MSEADLLIPYANTAMDQQPANPLLSRAVGGAVIVYGGAVLVCMALHVALARSWIASPPYVSWALGGLWNRVVMAAQALATALLLAGGAMMLRRSRTGILFVRWGAGGSCVLSLVGTAMALSQGSSYRSLWGTPAAATYQVLEMLQRLWPTLLMTLLASPPLARRL